MVKIWVKTHFYLGEDVEITSWFSLRFIENKGMAFGMELGSKLFLSLFRIAVVGALAYYLC
ncbi:MAG: signal peptidase II, partial [Muribaculaceae bacterium]|nr:signal peptidase II [Muribaculaceae bacterium]